MNRKEKKEGNPVRLKTEKLKRGDKRKKIKIARKNNKGQVSEAQ